MLTNLWPLRRTVFEAAKRVEAVHDRVPGKVGTVFGKQEEPEEWNTALTARNHTKSTLISDEAISSPMHFAGEASISALSFDKLKTAGLTNARNLITWR